MTRTIAADSRLNVGITFFASPQIQNIWANGTIQNVLFLYRLLELSPRIGKVVLINGGDADTIPANLLPESFQPQMGRLHEVVADLDVVIDFHVQLTPEQVQLARQHGCKLVQYKSGNVYVMDVENAIFNLKRPNSLNRGVQYDATWTLPHHAHTCKSYLETLYRTPVTVMPFLWEPIFLDWALQKTGIGERFFYRAESAGREKKRVAVFEPNFNIVKTCHYPILVCEEAYRARPELFSNIYINNIEHMRSQPNFVHFTHYLDIVQNKVASFEGRYDTPFFMANHADLVVTHNWENQLNNLYFDVLYGGYPLIHNSEMLGDVGYFYEPFNAQDGGRALISALTQHDQNLQEYEARSQRLFQKLSVSHPENIAAHVDRLFALYGL